MEALLRKFLDISESIIELSHIDVEMPGGWESEPGLEEARRVVRKRLFTAFHWSGTCAVLPRARKGVVDSPLRVYGTTNVRAVDASIFPIEPLGDFQSATYAVPEKAADVIKADW